jgi:lipopolysaccharide export system ATP-binding protein
MPLLEANGLVKSYATRRVVDGVSFSVERAEIVGLLGPNGAGKTTSFRMTCGMVEPDQGKVLLAGQDVTSWPMYRRAKAGMGYLAQESSVFKKLTVEQNLLGVMELLGKDWKTRKRVSDDLLDQFKITHIRHSKAGNISGGERRRLEIARCLVSDPEIILLDEPFTGIDPKTIESIQGIIRELRSRGISILITDHQVRETLQITDRSYVIHKGSVLCHGTPREVLSHPEARERYFGTGIDIGSVGPPAPHMRSGVDEPGAEDDAENGSSADDIPVNFKRPRRRNIHEDETLDADQS